MDLLPPELVYEILLFSDYIDIIHIVQQINFSILYTMIQNFGYINLIMISNIKTPRG